MDIVLTALAVIVAWRLLCLRYQRTHIALLGGHLADLRIERHMEMLTQGYTRAIHEQDEARQLQVLESFAEAERTVADQAHALAEAMGKESSQATGMGALPLCLPYVERFIPTLTRDFRELLRIHAAGLRHVVDNESRWGLKERAYHLSAELYLLQHSCHWFCKSRAVADARLVLRHQVKHQKVLESVSEPTRSAYLRWLRGG
ncbi:hypothetical protein [Castellaniella sp. S9]|uniref:hypothetical protein n=1 Tax=Castellaniella sp. S9 TaxID=2993652 RepID=UPI0022B39E10|nr:hypothetical protein [Castellaniella sp. S9]